MHSQYEERMAIRTAATMAQAQASFDNMAPAEASDTEAGLRYLIDEAEALIGRAERCIARGDMQAAIDLVRSAGNMLVEADWAEVEA